MGRTGTLLNKFGKFAVKFAVVFLVATFLFYFGLAVIFAVSILIPRPPDPPIRITLQETRDGPREEIWFAFRKWKGTGNIGASVRSDCEIREMGGPGSEDLIEERIYYIFVSPEPLRHREWNIETDEPNYVIRCADGDIEFIEKREQYMRDEQNRLIGPPLRQSN